MAKSNRQNRGKRPSDDESLFIGGAELKEEKEPSKVRGEDGEKIFDGKGKYRVIDPRRIYLGKSYSDWTTDWFNWFLSADADRRNSGPVVFLRSRGLPNSSTGANISEVPVPLPDSHSAGLDYRLTYINDPNIRIGSDRLQICEDQLVFVPIIIAYEIASIDSRKDWGWMQDFTGLIIDYGDNPPDDNQLTINNKEINLGLDMSNFRIITPIFTAVVPEASYGRSIKDFLEDSPIAPGNYPALVDGYFVMLQFQPGTYWVYSWASAPREGTGPYFSELLYQIEVTEKPLRDPHKGLLTRRPSRNEGVLNRTLYEKMKTGELTQPEINRFQRFFSTSLKNDTTQDLG